MIIPSFENDRFSDNGITTANGNNVIDSEKLPVVAVLCLALRTHWLFPIGLDWISLNKKKSARIQVLRRKPIPSDLKPLLHLIELWAGRHQIQFF